MNQPNTSLDISESLGKMPPQAPDVEESILGALLSDRNAIEQIVGFLKPRHFYNEAHIVMYQAMVDLFESSEPIELITVVSKLRNYGKLELVGGAYYVAQILSNVASAANIIVHARIVMEYSIKRELIQIASQIHHDAYEDTTDCFELLDLAEYSINQIRESKIKTRSYVGIDLAATVNQHGNTVQGGETCRVDELKNVFAWMRGFVNAWYGWSNDGKGTFFDYMAVLKAKVDGWKFCMYKQEDMDTQIISGKPKIVADRIYKNLAWSLTGKTWNKTFADRNPGAKLMTLAEEVEALEFITKHFFIVYPQDRRYKNILDEFKFQHDKNGIDAFLIDPFNAIELPQNERGDERLMKTFFDMKEFAMNTNSVFNIINHARSMNDVKEKDGKYKVVNQFMQLGGSAWDIKMDGQYSIYRPERHIDPKDPKVHFYNLKQRQSEIVGVERGEYEKIIFDRNKKQYFFNGVNPMDGSVMGSMAQGTVDFSQSPPPPPIDSDELPF